jgi:hypothetical protein
MSAHQYTCHLKHLKAIFTMLSSDTWAIGIIFFQLIKGLVPWRAISEKKLHEKIMT